MRKFFFIFLLFFSIEVLSGDSSCQKIFTSSSLEHERYTSVSLKTAMKSMDYKKIIDDYPPISQEDEKDLFEIKNENKNDIAFQILFLSNVYVVDMTVTTRFTNKNPLLRSMYDDLLQEGMMTLLKCLERYNHTKGFRFKTYLYRSIISDLNQYINRKIRLISYKWTPKRYVIFQAFKQLLDNNPDDFDLRSESSLYRFHKDNPQYSMEDIRLTAQFFEGPHDFLSFDSFARSESSRTLKETLPDLKIDEGEVIYQIDFRNIHAWTKEQFPHPIDQAIIEEKIFTDKPTEESLGNRFSITKQAISSRYKKIIQAIRQRIGYQYLE